MAATERDFLDRLERSRMRDIRRVAASTPQMVERERDIFDRVEDFLGSKKGIALSLAPQASIPVGLAETTIGLRNRSIPQTGLGILGLIPVFGGLAKKVAKHGDVFAEQALRQARNQSPMSRQIMVDMDIDEFLNLAESGPTVPNQRVRDALSSGEKFSDVPFLMFDNMGGGLAQVVGHEGRNRALALKEIGRTTMPVRLWSTEGGPGQAIRWGAQGDPSDYSFVGDFPSRIRPEGVSSDVYDVPFPVGQNYFQTAKYIK